MAERKFLYVGADGLPIESAGAYESGDHVSSSAGAGDAGKPILLDGDGNIDASMINDADVAHDSTGGMAASTGHTSFPLLSGTRPFTGNQSMGSFKITSLADGVDANDAVNKSQLDALGAGFDLKERCRVATDAALPAYTPSGSGVGKLITMDAVGILVIDGVNTVLSDRILVKDEATAHADHGIYEVTTEGTAGVAAILTRATDADGDPAGEVSNGMFSFILEGTNNSNSGWALITSPPITVDTTALEFSQFQGLPNYSASLGVELVGLDFRADLVSSGGIKLIGNELAVEPNDFAGSGMVDDGADNLAIDWSTAFNDSKAIKASDLSSNTNGFGASIIGIEDTNGYFTATDQEGVNDELFGLIGQPGVTYVVDTAGVTKGDIVYVSANDKIAPYSNLAQSHRGIGLALSTEISAANVKVLANDSVLTGVLTTATAGDPYYWDGSVLSSTIPSTSGSYVWQAGVAKNATDLHVEVRFVKKNA